MGGFYNPILVSYVAKGLLPYRGLGSGIPRALEAWPEMDFVDDRDGCLFTAIVHRKAAIGSEKTSGEILGALKQDGNMTIPELAALIGVTKRSIERNVRRLQEAGPTPPHRSGEGRALGGSMTYNEAEPRSFLIDPVLRKKGYDEHWESRLETPAPLAGDVLASTAG